MGRSALRRSVRLSDRAWLLFQRSRAALGLTHDAILERWASRELGELRRELGEAEYQRRIAGDESGAARQVTGMPPKRPDSAVSDDLGEWW